MANSGSEVEYLIWCLAILLGVSLMASVYLMWSTGTVQGQDFPLGRYFYNSGNYTISENFNQSNVSLQGIGATNVLGTWDINEAEGLHPTSLTNVAIIPFTSDYQARVKFGQVRYVNNSWEENYYLKNINRASNDNTAIAIRYGTYQNSFYFPGSYEMLLTINGDQVGIQEKNYVAGIDIGGNYFYGFTLPYGAAEGKLGYKAVNSGVGEIDPVNDAMNMQYSIEIYWNDQLMATIDHSVFQGITGSDDQTRSADVRTNIGSPNEAYNLEIMSHYEYVTVQSDTQAGFETGYNLNEVNKFLIIMSDVLLWTIPLGTELPWYVIAFVVGLPEFAVAYIAVRLIRGGG